MIDKDRNPPVHMDYEEFNRRIQFLQVGIENAKLWNDVFELKLEIEKLKKLIEKLMEDASD